MNVNMADLKLIRGKTKAGMLDCTKALDQAKGDLDLAEALLKEWGLAGVEDRADRAAREGRIFIRSEDAKAAMVELVCEDRFRLAGRSVSRRRREDSRHRLRAEAARSRCRDRESCR